MSAKWSEIRREPAGFWVSVRGALWRLVFWICYRPVLWLLGPDRDRHPEIRSFASLAGYLAGRKAPGLVAVQVLAGSPYLREKGHIDEAEELVVAWHGPGLRLGARVVCLLRHLDGGFSCVYNGWPGPRCATVAGAAAAVVRGSAPRSRLLVWVQRRRGHRIAAGS